MVLGIFNFSFFLKRPRRSREVELPIFTLGCGVRNEGSIRGNTKGANDEPENEKGGIRKIHGRKCFVMLLQAFAAVYVIEIRPEQMSRIGIEIRSMKYTKVKVSRHPNELLGRSNDRVKSRISALKGKDTFLIFLDIVY